MKTPVCLPTLVSAAALTLVLVAVLPTGATAADPTGPPGTGTVGTGTMGRPDPTVRGTSRPNDPNAAGATQLNEPYRANYFVDYHADPGNAGTGSSFVNSDDPNNLRERVDRRSDDSSTRDPFARELQRFRGEMSTRFR